ncbi:unnamed protein product [Bursaphelenchus okinawaensis]|uniref:Autophagy-related protein 2 n=1 Tax=Bursaphelenchus okinawaensis TaxID=465554 RepID=A0A811KQ85_9BILA|nr:unnamed protein product [Bursaphelenchus okinawaensis]CAG9110121.1 unnamed protein product [Bursaphelenchus okinawaensis]
MAFYKPLCRFLIHRYMGEYLNTQISTDQLELKLLEGTVSVQDVSLNADYINEQLKDVGLIRLIEGYVRELKVCVPWTKLMDESTIIYVKGLDLTFAPLNIDNFNAEMMSSMFGSIVSSMSRSTNEIIQEEIQNEVGKDNLALMIDNIINRMKVIFENTTIRLDSEAELATGIELRIEKMEFVDEVLEASEKQKQEGPVTAQPTSLYTVTELNKLVHFEGIQLFTDIYSSMRPSSVASDLSFDNKDNITSTTSLDTSAFQSCYSQLNTSARKESSVSGSNQLNLQTNPIPFLVIGGEKSTVRIRVNNTAVKSDGAYNKKMDVDFQLMGHAFAFLTPSQLSLITELLSKLTSAPSQEKPSHLTGGKPMGPEHFERLNDQLQGDAIVDQIIRDSHNTPPTATFHHGNALSHAYEQQFYEVKSHVAATRFSTISLDEPSHQRHGSGQTYASRSSGGDSDSLTDRGTHHGSNLTLTERRPNVFLFTFKMPSLVMIVTHDDPLSVDNIRKLRQSDPQAVCNQVKALKERADNFFKAALQPSPLIVTGAPLDQQRATFTALYPHDHLKLLCRSSVFKLTNEFDEVKGGSFDLQCSFGHMDLSEYLARESVVLNGTNGTENMGCHDDKSSTTYSATDKNSTTIHTTVPKEGLNIDIFNFSRYESDESSSRSYGHPTSSEANLTLRITNAIESREPTVLVEVNMSACQSEIDPSIIDRISALIVKQPFYKDRSLLLVDEILPPSSASTDGTTASALGLNNASLSLGLNEGFSAQNDGFLGQNDGFTATNSGLNDAFSTGLRDNFLDTDLFTKSSDKMQIQVRFYCPKWEIDLKIPVADYTETAPSASKRNLHHEFLKLQLDEARLEIPKFDPESIGTNLMLNVYASALQGSFIGDSEVLNCRHEDMTFLYANGFNSNSLGTQNVHIRIQFDSRNKSLHLVNKPDPLMAKSMYESYFQMGSENKAEGPFSKDGSYYEGQKIIQPGTNEELREFSEKAKQLAKINVELTMPQLNLHLPSHEFLEVMYNRFANDFALFEPKSNAYKAQERKRIQSHSFKECHKFTDFGASNGSSKSNFNDDEDESAGIKGNLFWMPRRPKKEYQQFGVQFGLELIDAQLFFVHGFDQDPNLDYMFLTSHKSFVHHRNLLDGVKSLQRNVMESNFCARRSADTHVEPLNASEPLQSDENDSLVVALKVHQVPEDNVRKIVVAFAVRNSTVHIKPSINPKHHFSQQFTDFFVLRDYGVPGYEWPKVSVGVHLNISNVCLAYDHCEVVPGSPMMARIGIGSCNLSAAFLEQSESHRFEVLLENSHFYLAKKRPTVTGPRKLGFSDQKRAKTNFVKLARFGLLRLDLSYQPGGEIEAGAQPQLSIRVTNDDFIVWTCSDTITELANMITEFMESDVGRSLTSKSRDNSTSEGNYTVDEEDLPSISSHGSSLRSNPASNLASNVKQNLPSNSSSNLKSTPSTNSMPRMKRPSSSSLSTQSIASQSPKRITAEQQEKLVELMESAMEEDTPSASRMENRPESSRKSSRNEDRKMSEGMGKRSEGMGKRSEEKQEEDPILAEMASAMQDSMLGDWNQTIYDNPVQELMPESPVFDREDDVTVTANSSRTFSDDEFVMIDDIVGSGITNAAGDPKVRIFDEEFVVSEDFLRVPDPEDVNEMVRLPASNPAPLIKYEVKDFSIMFYLFGGNDFGDGIEQKTYSEYETRRDDCDKYDSEGGSFRDHTVCVSANIHKISFISQLFNKDSPILSLNMLTIADIKVKDHLLISEINKLFYQYVSPAMPKRMAPLLSVRMVEDQGREGKLKISLLPIRLNIDQDTLEFLQDFINQIQKDIQPGQYDPSDDPPDLDLPVMEISPEIRPRSMDAESVATRKSSESSIQKHDSGLLPMQDDVSVQWKRSGERADSGGLIDLDDDSVNLFKGRPENLEDLFNGQLNFDDEPTSSTQYTRPYQPNIMDMSLQENQPIFNLGSQTAAPSVVADSEATETSERTRAVVLTRDTFFKEFTFDPACVIRLDYVGKRVKTDQGAFLGFLIGMTSLKCTEITLKELKNDRGVLGFNKCVQFALDQWLQDIRNNQIPNVVGSYQPISSLVQIAQGIRDLFYIPLVEMRKEDGRIVRGIQKGATSFGISTATAAIDATQQVFSVIQTAAELAFDLVTPDLPYRDHRRPHQQLTVARGRQVPSDLREGIHLAYDTVYQGVRETAFELTQAAKEDRARVRHSTNSTDSGGPTFWGFRGLLRQMTPTAIRPFVISSQAAVQVLAGMKNQLKPEDHKEELGKWRQRNSQKKRRHERR